MKSTTDESELDRLLLTVLDLDHSFGRAAVDQLDAKDVGIREGGSDVGLKVRGDTWAASTVIERLGRGGDVSFQAHDSFEKETGS